MPVIRRSDADGVDVRPRQQFLVRVVGLTSFPACRLFLGIGALHRLARSLAAIGVDITDGDDLHSRLAEKSTQQPAPLRAHANESHRNAFRGRRLRRPHPPRQNKRRRGAQGGSGKKSAAARVRNHKAKCRGWSGWSMLKQKNNGGGPVTGIKSFPE